MIMLLSGSTALFAQGTISGKVLDAESGEPLIGARVIAVGTDRGAATDLSGGFSFSVDPGTYTVQISYISYEDQMIEAKVATGGITDLGQVDMGSTAIGLEEVNIIASVAVDRKTPVAVSTVNTEYIEENLGSQELPEILKVTPGVYATKSGGGVGDARINIRGFNQRNVAVLINGVPVNDMENGWVYWSNWAGLGDAVNTIQVQRGLGASKLAINSVGGTMNIITKTTDAEKGGSIKQSMTSYGNSKTMVSLSTGLLDNGFAVSFVGSRTKGPGYVDMTFVDAWSYFLSVAKDFNNHRLVLTAIGAPQTHGQRDRFLSVADVDKYGIKYNKDWGWLYGEKVNQRVNQYHKPQIALNHYWQINEKNTLSSSYYISTGNGYGSGPLGDWTTTDALGQIDWTSVAEGNASNNDTLRHVARNDDVINSGDYVISNGDTVVGGYSNTILRNSVNNHFWTGLLTTLKSDLSSNLSLTAGIDARYYKGEHYREVRNLLGGDYYFDGFKYALDGINPNYPLFNQVGDRIAYDNDGIVRYGGLFSQLEYSTGPLSAFVAATIAQTGYGRVDRYNYHKRDETVVNSPSDIDYGINSQSANAFGYNAKAGANYNINDKHNVFFNTGYYSRAPFFNFVYVDFANVLSNETLVNEKVAAFELGYGFTSKYASIKLNGYMTQWQDKSILGRRITRADGSQYRPFIQGLDATHRGIEAEFMTRPFKVLELGGMISLGDWFWTNDVQAILQDDGSTTADTVNLYTAGLKVGDAPQTQFGLQAKLNVTRNIDLGATYVYNDNLYAQFDPEDRQDPDYREQSYELPAYGVLDMRAGYRFDIGGMDAYAGVNCYNVLNNIYIQEAVDVTRQADDPDPIEAGILQGFWGFGRNWNFSLKLNF